MAAKRYEMTDAERERIKDMIHHVKTGRRPRTTGWCLMLWLAISGVAWADMPARYGSHQTVYSRFCKWHDDGTLLRFF